MRAAWRRLWRTLGRGCVGLACALALPAGAAQQALLVGVSEYPALPERRLAGPANDVRLMVRSLSSLGWQPGQMQVLAEQGDAMPSRANILQALARLAQSSRSGDWVLLYFSGHGAQVPSKTGLDEVFLPRDTAFWDAQRQEVKGALRDKELAAALQRIRAQGANVWAVFDTCHAADMLRGRASGRARFISAPELRIPVQLWSSVQPAASSRRDRPGRVHRLLCRQQGRRLAGGVAARPVRRRQARALWPVHLGPGPGPARVGAQRLCRTGASHRCRLRRAAVPDTGVHREAGAARSVVTVREGLHKSA